MLRAHKNKTGKRQNTIGLCMFNKVKQTSSSARLNHIGVPSRDMLIRSITTGHQPVV